MTTTKTTTKQEKAVLSALTQTVAAWLVGKSSRTFRDSAAPRNSDGSYDGRALFEWQRDTAAGEGDPLLADGDSPALERYRTARAVLAELDAQERQGSVVNVDEFVTWWQSEIATPLSRAVDALRVRFGADAAELIETAIRKADKAVAKRRPVE